LARGIQNWVLKLNMKLCVSKLDIQNKTPISQSTTLKNLKIKIKNKKKKKTNKQTNDCTVTNVNHSTQRNH
jgi:hypothetical protein